MWLLACASPAVTEIGETDVTDIAPLCVPGSELPSCDVADACRDRFPANPPLECVEKLAWSSTCDPGWHDETTTQDRLIYAGGLREPFSHTGQHTITDAESWTDFQAGFEDTSAWPAVDFASSIVVIAPLMVNSTCGMHLVRHGVWITTGGEYYPAQVYVEWADSTGACDEVCDMAMQSAVIYAVPRSRGWPEVCSTVINTCD